MLSKQQLPQHVLPAQMADLIHDPTVELQFQAQLASEWQDIQARLLKLDAEVTRRQAEIATVQQSIAKRVEQERDLSVQRARLNEVQSALKEIVGRPYCQFAASTGFKAVA